LREVVNQAHTATFFLRYGLGLWAKFDELGQQYIGWLGRVAGLLGCLGHARRGRGEQASRADSQVSAHSAGVKRKLFIFQIVL
jgi:hypothetical protein